jgi:Single Cache domain 2
MLRNLGFVISFALILLLNTIASVWAAEFGTEEEAKAMLQDKAKALEMFNKGEDGFKDRDLYVWCANASDGIITATPYWNRGKQLKDIKGKRGAPFGETVMQNATERTIKQTTYWWPRPGIEKPLEKTALYTKVGDQICSVGYYKE